LGVDRRDLVPEVNPRYLDGLSDALGHIGLGLPDFGVGDIDGFGLVGHAVDETGVIGDRHLNRETQILCRLPGNIDDCRVRHASVIKRNILDILGPDRRGTDDTRANGKGACRGSTFQNIAPANIVSIVFSCLVAHQILLVQFPTLPLVPSGRDIFCRFDPLFGRLDPPLRQTPRMYQHIALFRAAGMSHPTSFPA